MTDESKTPDLDALARETIALGERATKGPDGPECVKCGGYMTIQYGDEPTVLCHNCAHQVAETDAPALATALLEAKEALGQIARIGHAAVEVVDAYDAGGERPSVVDQDRLQHAMSGLRDALRSGAGQGEPSC